MATTRRALGGIALFSLALAALSAAAPLSCSVVVDLEGLEGGQRDLGPVDAGADSAPTCAHAGWPGPPASAPEGGNVDFVAALRSIDLGESNPADPAGLDLDGLCTCDTEGPSCAYPPYAKADHCDGKQGRDNSVARVFKQVQFLAPSFGSHTFSDNAEKGNWSMLVRVWNWNGQDDDAQVNVALYQTFWKASTQPTEAPQWEGLDLWPVAATSLVDGVSFDNARYLDKAAYVTGGVVVASLPEAFFGINGVDSNVGIKLTAGTLVARIEHVKASSYRLVDGVVGGRWKVDDIFKVLGAFEFNDQVLCNDGDTAYTAMKQLLCNNIDIASTLGGPTTPCDSLSFGMTFHTEPALISKTYIPQPDDPKCMPDQDPANDSCDK
jgi:hypothetical protein